MLCKCTIVLIVLDNCKFTQHDLLLCLASTLYMDACNMKFISPVALDVSLVRCIHLTSETSSATGEINFILQASMYSVEAKHSNRSCYVNLQLSRTIKTIVHLHSMTCCYAQLRHCPCMVTFIAEKYSYYTLGGKKSG